MNLLGMDVTSQVFISRCLVVLGLMASDTTGKPKAVSIIQPDLLIQSMAKEATVGMIYALSMFLCFYSLHASLASGNSTIIITIFAGLFAHCSFVPHRCLSSAMAMLLAGALPCLNTQVQS